MDPPLHETTAEQAGAVADVHFTYGYDAVWNHPEETHRLKTLVETISRGHSPG